MKHSSGNILPESIQTPNNELQFKGGREGKELKKNKN
jgi:hypothetical protein